MNMSLYGPPTVAEVEKAIAAVSRGKALRSDAIQVEVYKTGSTRLAIKIKELFEIIWNAKGLPQECKDATNLHLYKCIVTTTVSFLSS